MSLCVMREFQGEFEPVGSFDAVDTGDIIFSCLLYTSDAADE